MCCMVILDETTERMRGRVTFSACTRHVEDNCDRNNCRGERRGEPDRNGKTKKRSSRFMTAALTAIILETRDAK